ncbi:MAG: hypothetical protein ACYTG0_13455 [Planctomycetota bacterium]|jgi:hypothetical protein
MIHGNDFVDLPGSKWRRSIIMVMVRRKPRDARYRYYDGIQ